MKPYRAGSATRFAVAFAVIAAVIGAIAHSSQPVSAPQSLPTWPMIDAGSVRHLQIVHGTQPVVELQQKEGKWFLGEAGADEEAVRHLLDDLAGMRIVRLVTEKSERHTMLQVDDAGYRVQLFNDAGQSVLDMMVGKQGRDILSTYVRLRGKPEVVAVDRTLVWQVRRSPDSWKAPAESGTGAK